MQVKGIAEHSAILSTFIKLPFVIKIDYFSGRFTQVLLYVSDYGRHLKIEPVTVIDKMLLRM